ncbi:MAG: hypothetical protein HC916_00615 [Coleofasciculaceae cyanobacterium SM2_1_6]|nr:hypothetical protein [Coleofasciculaceae cyanobacterium SM2_1_6]
MADKEEILRRVTRRIEQDDEFAANVGAALDAEDDAWLFSLILDVIGVIIEIGSSIWDWVKRQFS